MFKTTFALASVVALTAFMVPAVASAQDATRPFVTPIDDYELRELAAPEAIRNTLAELRERGEARDWTFEVGYTSALDFAIADITGLVVPQDWQEQAVEQNERARDLVDETLRDELEASCSATATAFDWRDHNGSTPVRDQGACGSCWAFATHGAFEGSYAVRNGVRIDSAEQDTLDCSGAGSCSGGWWAHQYLIDTGSATEAAYPYTATDGTCRSGVSRPYDAVAWGYVDSASAVPSVSALKTALCRYGPLAVAVRVTSAFQAYRSGVFNETDDGSVNHGVTLLGWDDATSSWVIKNSWGTGWGESGYMRIAYGSNSVGYAASWSQAEVVPTTGLEVSAASTTSGFRCDTSWRTVLAKRATFGRGELVASYQQENFPGCRLMLRLRRDGTAVGGAGEAGAPFAVIDENDTLQTNGFEWVVDEAGGTHTYDVQCRCASGRAASIDERTLVLTHR